MRNWVLITFLLLGGSALANCEESSRSATGDDSEFFIVCQSSEADPVSYVLTKFISGLQSHGVLRFQAGRKGFFCAVQGAGSPICHASNFGLVPDGEFKSSHGFTWVIRKLEAIEPVSNPEFSFPRNNRIDSATDCYIAVKAQTVTMGVRKSAPYGVERCLISLGRVERSKLSM